MLLNRVFSPVFGVGNFKHGEVNVFEGYRKVRSKEIHSHRFRNRGIRIKEIGRLKMCSLLIKQQIIKYEAACQQSEILVNFIDKRNSKPVRAEHRIACAGVGADVKN